jgi:hypothetical protein
MVHPIVTAAGGGHGTVSGMPPSPQHVTDQRRTLPQPGPPAWSAALVPSQVRAADHRAQLQRRRSAQRWLRDLDRR